ncbi:MAG: hypothetical protein RL499_1318, partial [Actinomycetota bacterium]
VAGYEFDEKRCAQTWGLIQRSGITTADTLRSGALPLG